MIPHRWTEKETRVVRREYKGTAASAEAIAAKLGLRPRQVKSKIQTLGIRRGSRLWTERELQYLSDNYGVKPDTEICLYLRRTRYAIILRAKRMKINRKMNGFTASELARVLGLACSKTITDTWMPNGLIEGCKSPTLAGRNLMWFFTDEQIEACLRRRPWLVNLKKVESYNNFRRVVQDEWNRDPWYTAVAAGPKLGVCSDVLKRYIGQGWLKGEKMPGPGRTQWVIRQSAIDEFLKNDRRRELATEHMLAGRRRRAFECGRGVVAGRLWEMRCPLCGKIQTLLADYKTSGTDVSLWYREHNDECPHGKVLDMRRMRG